LTICGSITVALSVHAQQPAARPRVELTRDSTVYAVVLDRLYGPEGFVARETYRDTSLTVTEGMAEPDSGAIAEAEAALAAALRLPPESVVPALKRWASTAWVNADETVVKEGGQTNIRTIASVSRIGYSRDFRWAAVLFRTACNALCGGIHLVILENRPAGWHIYRKRPLVFY
jgi:hypothetical protein